MRKCNKTSCMQKVYAYNPSARACEIDKFLKRITGDSIVICDEIIKVTKTIQQQLFQQKLF